MSRGIAIGTLVCLFGTRRQFFRRAVAEANIDIELDKFERSLADASARIDKEIEDVATNSVSAITEILQTHRLILTDPTLRSSIEENIRAGKMNAEWAVHTACELIAARFLEQSDPHLKEKRLDLEDVCDRVLACLGTAETELDLPSKSVIAAKEISPSMLINLAAKGIVGMISESGGWTSHTSILARELGIPAVTGLIDIFEQFENGKVVMVDGLSGDVIIQPKPETVQIKMGGATVAATQLSPITSERNFSTIDGREITIRTNTTTIEGYRTAQDFGAAGIGLFRSESLIGPDGSIPSEDDQTTRYIEIARGAGGDGVRIRTFDLDAGQFEPTRSLRQKNPALGLRAVRLGLTNPDLLKTQVRALLRGANDNRIGLVVPMVSGVSEIDAVKKIVESESIELRRSKVSIGTLDIGVMIEVPASVFVVDQLAAACDFLCLGTNDLAQYLLAADRDNESVSKWFRTLHPAMIRAVNRVIDQCRLAAKPLIVCGEMAGSPFYIPVLIGLGATELSMNPSSIAAVTRVISGISYDDAVQLVQRIEGLSDPDEMESIVAETARSKWQHLFAPGFLEMQSQ